VCARLAHLSLSAILAGYGRALARCGSRHLRRIGRGVVTRVRMRIDWGKTVGIGLHGLRRLSQIRPRRVRIAWMRRILLCGLHVS
jgi:hypothetical protein